MQKERKDPEKSNDYHPICYTCEKKYLTKIIDLEFCKIKKQIQEQNQELNEEISQIIEITNDTQNNFDLYQLTVRRINVSKFNFFLERVSRFRI